MTNTEAAKVLTEHLRTLTDYDAREAYHCAIDALSVDEAKERERFEAWAMSDPEVRFECVSDGAGSYEGIASDAAWSAWLARARGEG